MKRGFSKSRGGTIRLRLDSVEITVLDDLVQQFSDLVSPAPIDPDADPLAALVGIDEHAEIPVDPALLRLLPDAYKDDEAASADFRRFTERSLREGKAERAATVMQGLAALAASDGQAEISREDSQAWLGSLNDLRLVLASRLSVDDDEGVWRRRIEGDPEAEQGAVVYDWLTWLQDCLVNALMK